MIKSELNWLFSREDYLSKSNTDCLKGIFVAIIVLAHTRGMTTIFNDTIIGMILTASGYLAVAMFFFFSGYGMWFSAQKRGIYIKAFPRNRILDFYIKYIILILVYTLFGILRTGYVAPEDILLAAVFLNNIIVFGWYLHAIFFLYLVFWIVMRFIPLKRVEAKAVLITIIYFIIIILTRKESIMLYCQSVLAFPLGMLWCEYKKKIDDILSGKKYYIGLLLSFIAFSAFLLLGNLNILNEALKNISKFISAPVFVVFVLMLVKPFNINNMVTRKLGDISFEIYVFQGVFLNLFVSKYIHIDNFILYFIASMGCTVVFSLIMHPVFVCISKKIKKS